MKMWMIIGAALIALGLVLFCVVMSEVQWDFAKLSTVKYETHIHPVEEIFYNISMKTDTADISFVRSDDGKYKVVCYEQVGVTHEVSVEDGTLTVQEKDRRNWYERIGFGFGTPKVTVYLPGNAYGNLLIEESTGDIDLPKTLKFERVDISASTGDVDCYASVTGQLRIKLSTGDIHVENISAGELDLTVSTGKVSAEAVTCEGNLTVNVSTGKTELEDIHTKNLISGGDTGSISLENVIASERFSIERNTGNVKFDGCDAAELFVKTSTGNVRGSLLSDKVFLAQTDTGRVDVPKSVTGGRCEITTDTGDIVINID